MWRESQPYFYTDVQEKKRLTTDVHIKYCKHSQVFSLEEHFTHIILSKQYLYKEFRRKMQKMREYKCHWGQGDEPRT